MKLYRLKESILLEDSGSFFKSENTDFTVLLEQEDLIEAINQMDLKAIASEEAQIEIEKGILAPIGQQEVWAAGVTYYRSRTARMEESEKAGGSTFYDKVYDAARPELFMKATARQVVGPKGTVNIRLDSTWDVPEPELTLLISPKGKITGYTIGNDMSSRSIEGENPLYLPQAKVYDGSAAIGPCILVAQEELPATTEITLQIERNGAEAFRESTQLEQLKRKPKELVEWLYRECSFPNGCFLMTGTGIVPDNFSLEPGDVVHISIEGIGTLTNKVGKKKNYSI